MTPDLSALKLVNYYPADAAQSRMYSAWNPDAIDADFAKIAAMGANAVRVAVWDWNADADDKVDDIVKAACYQGLKVKLTLFAGCNPAYNQALFQSYASSLLAPFSNRKCICAVDLCNELDLTDPARLAWAKAMLPYVQQLLPGVPVTISVSNTAGLAGLQRIKDAGLAVDFYELHYYGIPELAYDTFAKAQAICGDVPLLIGEVGRASDPAAYGDTTHDAAWCEAYQDQYHRTVQAACQALGLPPAAPWCWSDFTADAFPTTQAKVEYSYGLVSVSGEEKLAALGYEALWEMGIVTQDFNTGFQRDQQCWSKWLPNAAVFGIDPDSGPGRTINSAFIRQSAPATSAGIPAWYTTPVIPTRPGHSYRLSAWMRGQDATGVNRLALAWFDAQSRYIGGYPSAPLPAGTSDWKQASVTVQAPTTAAYCEIHLQSAGNSGTVWFDDVEFVEAAG